MSGLAGLICDEPAAEVARRLQDVVRRFSGTNHAAAIHAEEGFGVAVTSRAPERHAGSSFGEIVRDERYVVAVEGYILNVAELSERTGLPPGAPRGASLLHQFAVEGERTLERLDGACLVVVWDRHERVGYLVNCRFGRRELFLAGRSPRQAFASEPAVLSPLIDQRLGLNTEITRELFLCGGIYGEDWPLAGVTRPWPGSLCVVRDGRCERRLLDIVAGDGLGTPRSRDAYLGELDARLVQSAERLSRVTPDRVVMMSGGVDSPLAAAYVRRVTGAVASLTIGVPFGIDEREPAARLAAALGSRHRSRLFDVERLDLIEGMRRFVRAVQEPAWISTGVALLDVEDAFPDLPTGIVSGYGADTLFGLSGSDASGSRSTSLFRYVINPVAEDRAEGLIALSGPHPDRLLAALGGLVETTAENDFINVRRLTEAASLVRTSARLARASGREALFTYLDRDLYRTALALPVSLREGDKPMLRTLWKRMFPSDLMVDAKVPFVTHTLRWFHDVGRVEPVLDLLVERRTLDRGFYEPRALRQLVARYRDRTREVDYRWHSVVWQMAIFELFCREFIDRDVRHGESARGAATAGTSPYVPVQPAPWPPSSS